MALTPSGTISMSNLNTVLGRSATAPISMNDSQVRWVANQVTGAVSLGSARSRDVYAGTITPGTLSGKGGGFQRGYFLDFGSYIGSATGELYGVSPTGGYEIYGGQEGDGSGAYGRVFIYNYGTLIGPSTIRLRVGNNTGISLVDYGAFNGKLWGADGINPVVNTGVQSWTIVSP